MRITFLTANLFLVKTMALTYKVISTTKPGQGRDGGQIWFPKLTGSSKVDLWEVARTLAKRSTASESDVFLVITGLVTLIPELLLQGKTVKLDNLGSFRLHARVRTSPSRGEVSVKNIREIRLSFKPDNVIKEALRGAEITPGKR